MSPTSGVVTGGTTLFPTNAAVDQANKTPTNVDCPSAEWALKTYVKNKLSSLLRHRHSHYDLQTSLPLAPMASPLTTSMAPSECQLAMAMQNGIKSHLAPPLSLAPFSATKQHSGTSEINNNHQEDEMKQRNVSCPPVGPKHLDDNYAPLSEANNKLVDNSTPRGVTLEIANNSDNRLKRVEMKSIAEDKNAQEKSWDSNRVQRTKQLLLGIALTVLSGFCFSITTLLVKYVKNVSPGTMAGFRYLVLESNQPIFGPSGAYLWILLRGLSGGSSVFCRYSALRYMSMADSTIIILSMPVFVFVFARIFLKEHFGRYHVLSLVMSIVGIIFASKIDFLFSSPMLQSVNGTELINQTLPTNESTTSVTTPFYSENTSNVTSYDSGLLPFYVSDKMIGTAFSLGATLIGCFVYIIIRKLKQVNKSVILFNFSIISFLEMLVIDYFFYDFNLPLEGWSPYFMTLVGLLSFYAQLLLTRAIQLEEAGVVSVVRTSSEAFFAFVFQILFFGQLPDVYSITGALLVLSSVFLISVHKYFRSLPENDPTRQRFMFLAK